MMNMQRTTLSVWSTAKGNLEETLSCFVIPAKAGIHGR